MHQQHGRHRIFIKLINLVIFLLAFCQSAQAAWYLDRDNTMIPAEPEVGDAMAVILGGNGTVTQAIQVCSGVYLATAHGALDDPIEAKKLNRPYRPPGQFAMRLIAYPMEPENMTQALDAEDYISPRIGNNALWDENHTDFEKTDYVFVSVDEPKRIGNTIRPILASPESLDQLKSRISIFMYRGRSRFLKMPNGSIDYRDETAISQSDTTSLKTLYQEPQRVQEPCEIAGGNFREFISLGKRGLLGHNCPSENSASGASYVIWQDQTPYLVGINIRGVNLNLDGLDWRDLPGSTILTSSTFCADYERACGQPCATIDEVLGE